MDRVSAGQSEVSWVPSSAEFSAVFSVAKLSVTYFRRVWGSTESELVLSGRENSKTLNWSAEGQSSTSLRLDLVFKKKVAILPTG